MNALGILSETIAARRPGFSLERTFYTDPDLFKLEMERVVFSQWLMVDHVSRIPNSGDYFVYPVAGEEIIVVRGQDGEIRAFYNVCRHRGSRICRETQGNAKLLRCPYHAWSFDLEGNLRAARLMPDDFDPGNYSLHACHVGIGEGLIFLNLSRDGTPDFEAFIAPLRPFMQLHGLADARVAHRGAYPTDANWKLVLENFYECYHCQPSHPEYCQVHPAEYVLAYGGGRGSGPEEAEQAYQPQLDAFNERAAAMGHLTGGFHDEIAGEVWRGAERTPIGEGRLSETQDGTPAAPLMSGFNDWDGGYTAVAISPFATLLMTNDFATAFRFTPVSPTRTEVDLFWMVRGDSVDGRDVDIEKMIWLWDVTTIADKRIIEDNQAGVLSRMYRPGPYSRHEKGVEALIRWYLGRLGDA